MATMLQTKFSNELYMQEKLYILIHIELKFVT